MRSKSQQLTQNIVNFINDYYVINGNSPSLNDIALELGVNKSTISRYISELVNCGKVFTSGHRGLTTEFIQKRTGVTQVPIVGNVACGVPIWATENLIDEIYISSGVLGVGQFFGLIAKGDSMINAGIDDGDIVLVRKQSTAEQGEIVVALVDDSATLKRFFIDEKTKQVRLHPENDQMDDMFFDCIEIQGVVKKIIKNAN